MFELKPLSRNAIPAALEKAMRYRFLNEPSEAESICHDILMIEPQHQQALVLLLLALTDQFGTGHGGCTQHALDVLPRITDSYERLYYAGIIAERRAKAQLDNASPGCGFAAYDWLREAMTLYEQAEAIRPAGNDDAVLRWNACARMIMRNHLSARPEETFEPSLE